MAKTESVRTFLLKYVRWVRLQNDTTREGSKGGGMYGDYRNPVD